MYRCTFGINSNQIFTRTLVKCNVFLELILYFLTHTHFYDEFVFRNQITCCHVVGTQAKFGKSQHQRTHRNQFLKI